MNASNETRNSIFIYFQGVVFAFSAYFRSESNPMRFQIWRPGNVTNQFVLISDFRVVPSVKSMREDVSISAI